MILSREEVEHVAMLARLEMDEEEFEQYQRQLSDILKYVEKLSVLDTREVEPTAHVLPLRNVMREDTAKEGIDRKGALKNAPQEQEGQFRVPKIV